MNLWFFSDGLHQQLEGKPPQGNVLPQPFQAALFPKETQPVCHALDKESNSDLMILVFVAPLVLA